MKQFIAFLTLAVLLTTAAAFAQEAAAKPELKGGLLGEYWSFDEGLDNLPDVPADKQPVTRLIDQQVDFPSTAEGFGQTKLLDHFFVRWTGILRVAKAGKYTLALTSDDGSRLFLDGKQIVDNGGLHGMEEKTGDVELTAGDHQLKVEFFENEGDAGCQLSWQLEGADKEIVPAGVLFHPADAELDKAPAAEKTDK